MIFKNKLLTWDLWAPCTVCRVTYGPSMVSIDLYTRPFFANFPYTPAHIATIRLLFLCFLDNL